MQNMAGLTAAWELWERSIIPSLLSGASTWFGKIDQTINFCNESQNYPGRQFLICPNLAQK